MSITNKSYHVVAVPQLGVNDDYVIVTEQFLEQESQVEKGDSLFTVESTKTSIDVEAEKSGFFFAVVNEKDEVAINSDLAFIFETMEELKLFKESWIKEQKESQASEEKSSVSSQNITKKAMALIKKHSVDLSDFKSDLSIIREKDVLTYLASKQEPREFDAFKKGLIPVVVYGCGNGARVIFETLSLVEEFQVVGFIADRENYDNEINGIPVIPFYNADLLKSRGINKLVLSITDSLERLKIFKQLKEDHFDLINVIHKTAYVSPSVKLGEGNHIKAGAVIDTNSVVGNACIIDNNVTIPHDNFIGDGVHLAPNVTLGSSIKIGQNSIVGIGSSISTDIKIGDYSIISVGSSVTSHVENKSIIEGVPGKVVGKRKL